MYECMCMCLSGRLVERMDEWIDWMHGWVTRNSMATFLLLLLLLSNHFSTPLVNWVCMCWQVSRLIYFSLSLSFLPSSRCSFLPIEIIASGSLFLHSVTQSFDDCIAFLMHFTRQIVPRLNFHSLSNFDCLSHLFLVRKITKSPLSISFRSLQTRRL